MMTNVLDEVGNERRRQDSQWGPDNDDGHSLNDWVALITKHAGKAVSGDDSEQATYNARKQLLRVAALAVAAVEALDRNNNKLRGY